MSHHALLQALGLCPESDAPHDAADPARRAGGSSTAVVAGEHVLSRSVLLERAHDRAAAIRAAVPPDGRVGLLDTHDADAVIAVVAALLSGRSLAMLGEAASGPLAPARGDSDAPAAPNAPPDPLPAAVRALAAASRCHAVVRGPDLIPVTADASDPRTDPTHGLAPGDPREAVVLFTSGTTGTPRGVRLSSANVLANLTAVRAVAAPWGPDDRLGQMLTLTHSFGLSMLLLAIAARVPVVLVPPEPGRPLLRALADSGATAFACVPYTLRLLSRRRLHLDSAATPALRYLYLAGGGIGDDEITDLLGDFGGELFCMYGFTEATARAAVRRYVPGDGLAGSVGLPLPGTLVQIVDDEGHLLPPGVEGRVRVHSPSLMIGYLGEPPRRAGEPVTTNDLGTLDAAGHLTITGRDVEMMNFRGNRVSVVGLEAQAMRLDGVLGARAIPDSGAEDAPCTLHVVVAPAVDPAHIRRTVVRDLSPRGIVKDIVVVDDLPTTRSGKLLRHPVPTAGAVSTEPTTSGQGEPTVRSLP